MASTSKGTKSRGRGTAAAFGFVLLVAGLIGAGVLFYLSTIRPADAIKSFARAGAGCTTTLDFQNAGDFYVYQEVDSGAFEPTDGCEPAANGDTPFDFTLTGPAQVTPTDDRSVSYDSGDFVGTSVARFEITEPGLYEIAVVADDVTAVAAVGRDPDDGVSDLRRGAVFAAAAGIALGLLLLVLAGRRSHKAAAPTMPDGPGWAPRPPDEGWPPAPPTVPVQRMPINPTQPDTPVEVTPPPPPLPAREPGTGWTSPSWAPPGATPVSTEAPAPPEAPRAPQPIPTLPPRPMGPAPTAAAAPPPSPVPPPPITDTAWRVTLPPPAPPAPPRGSDDDDVRDDA